MYDLGREVAQSYGKAFELYTRAAEQGDPVALYRLCLLYEHGTCVTKDLQKALDLYAKASERGNVEAGIQPHIINNMYPRTLKK